MGIRGIVVAFAIFVAAACLGCSTKPPSLRVANERTTKANLQIKPANGSTFNINDVAGGTSSAFMDIASGHYEATATIQSESSVPSVVFIAEEDYNYTVVVTTGGTPSLRVDRGDK